MELKDKDRGMEKLYEDLIDGFMYYQHYLDCPSLVPEFIEKDKLIENYRTDTVFHQKVQSLASNVLTIVQKHID